MPRNRAGWLRRRMRQADDGLERAIRYLGEIRATFEEVGYQDLESETRAYMEKLDRIRQLHLEWYREVWGGTERGLWKEDDLQLVLDLSEPVPDPDYD